MCANVRQNQTVQTTKDTNIEMCNIKEEFLNVFFYKVAGADPDGGWGSESRVLGVLT